MSKSISFFVSCACPLPLSGSPRRTLLMVATTTIERKQQTMASTMSEVQKTSFADLPLSKEVRRAASRPGLEDPDAHRDLGAARASGWG